MASQNVRLRLPTLRQTISAVTTVQQWMYVHYKTQTAHPIYKQLIPSARHIRPQKITFQHKNKISAVIHDSSLLVFYILYTPNYILIYHNMIIVTIKRSIYSILLELYKFYFTLYRIVYSCIKLYTCINIIVGSKPISYWLFGPIHTEHNCTARHIWTKDVWKRTILRMDVLCPYPKSPQNPILEDLPMQNLLYR